VISIVLALAFAISPRPSNRPCNRHGGWTVPHGRPILIDGRIGADEWGDACEIVVTPSYRILLKRDSAYIYLAIVRSVPEVFGVNLYLATPGSDSAYLDLHASAKLGERVGRHNAWPEWVWWNNRGWSANVERFNAFTGQRFLPDTAKELQIALARLPGKQFLLTFDIETVDGTELPVADGPVHDGMHWIPVGLAP
jgi:hypothetical protein